MLQRRAIPCRGRNGADAGGARPRAGARDVIRRSTCRRWTTRRWTATRCARADVPAARTRLRVAQRIAAGHVGEPLEPGTAARIFTGAPIPPGADAIVMQEIVRGRGRPRHRRTKCRSRGEWIRRAGEDIRAGATILAAGTRLRPQELGLAASVGHRGAAGVPAAARRAVLHRRRAGDAGRAAAAGRDLQLQPLHAERPAAAARLRGRPISASCPIRSRRRARRCAAAAATSRPDHHLGRRVGRRGGSRQAGGRGRRARSTCGRSR